MLALRCLAMINFSIFTVLGSLLLASCSEEKKESRTELTHPRDEKIASLEVKLSELKAEAQRERDQFRIQSEANTLVMGQLKDLLVDLKEKAESPPEVAVEPMAVVDKKAQGLEERRWVLDSIRMARLVAVGEEPDLIVTERGEPFYDVVITEVNDIGISIRHRGGAGRIAFEDLPNSWQERFGYDPVRAAKTLEREHIVQAKYEISASKELLAQKEKNEKLDRELREARLALAVAQASQPALAVTDQDPNLIPVRQTIIHDHHYDDRYSSRPIFEVPVLEVPIIGGNRTSTYCPPPTQTYPQDPGSGAVLRPSSSRPSVQRPVHNESVTRPPITRPPSGSTSSPAQRPTPSQPAVQRPVPSHNEAVSRPSITRPPGR
ncbi:MAG: hypothetical protein QNL33_19235 [Akkermansiaceae bacterium]